MSNREVRRLSAVAKTVAEVLSVHPDGLQFYPLLERATHNSIDGNESGEKDVRRSAIAMIKAGWIVIDRGRWVISEKGTLALARYADPDEFLHEAARQSLRGWLAIHTPLYLYGVQGLEMLSVMFRRIRSITLFPYSGIAIKGQKYLPTGSTVAA